MGKKLLTEASKLNFLNFPKTMLYAMTNGIRPSMGIYFISYIPNIVDEVWNYLVALDKYTKFEKSKAARNKTLYYLSKQLNIYIEIESRVSGLLLIKSSNYVLKLNFFCENFEHIKRIAHRINDNFVGGILNELNWDKIEKEFHINREEAIFMWQKILK